MTTDHNNLAAQVLAHLDDLEDDAAAHIYPSDLAKCSTTECVVEVASVRVGNGDERSVPLFSRDQVAQALEAAGRVQQDEPVGAAEAAEIIGDLIANIEAQGMYSKESTLGFLSQAYFCLKPANPPLAAPAERAPAPAVAAAAWMHADDPRRVISAMQKGDALKDGGASASSVSNYSVELVLRHEAAPTAQEASKPVQAEAPSEPMRAHIEQFATRAGWKMEEGEGAFEFVQRKCYQQGWIDHGTKSRDREDDTSASQDQGPDTGRVSGESGPAAEQHNEHRTGQSGADREHDQRDCRGAGLHGASNLPPQVAQKPDFIYNGERGRDAEDLLDGYNHGTAFYASPVLLRIDRAIEPLTSGEIRALMAKHGIAFTNINTVEALVRDVELEHGRGVANPKARAAPTAQEASKPADEMRPDFEWWWTTRGIFPALGTTEAAAAWAAWVASGGYTAPSDWKLSDAPWGWQEVVSAPRAQQAAPSVQAEREALRGLLEIEDARIATGAFTPNAEAKKRIDAARAALASTPVGGGKQA